MFRRMDEYSIKRSELKPERTFTVPESEATIHARVAAFLEQSGYKSVATEHSITYRRGDLLGFASFSPNCWRVKATVQIAPSSSQNQVTAVFDVDTTFQWVTEKERAFWKSELDCLEAAAITGVIDTAMNTKPAQSARI